MREDELVRMVAAKIMAICHADKDMPPRLSFSSLDPIADRDYLIDRVRKSQQYLDGPSDTRNLRHELFRLAGWAVAAGAAESSCRMIFGELAWLYARPGASQDDEDLSLALRILQGDDGSSKAVPLGHSLQSQILSAIWQDDRGLPFGQELHFGDGQFWVQAYRAYVEGNLGALTDLLITLAEIWSEDRDFDTFVVQNKYFCFFEIELNALLAVLQNKLNWHPKFEDESVKNFYLPAQLRL